MGNLGQSSTKKALFIPLFTIPILEFWVGCVSLLLTFVLPSCSYSRPSVMGLTWDLLMTYLGLTCKYDVCLMGTEFPKASRTHPEGIR